MQKDEADREKVKAIRRKLMEDTADLMKPKAEKRRLAQSYISE